MSHATVPARERVYRLCRRERAGTGLRYPASFRTVVIMAKTARVDLRLHPDDDALIRRAAEHLHESVNVFVARVARSEAEQVLFDRSFAAVDGDEFDRLERRLRQPPRPNARLKAFLAEEAKPARGARRPA